MSVFKSHKILSPLCLFFFFVSLSASLSPAGFKESYSTLLLQNKPQRQHSMLFFIVKPVFCHCLPSFLSSISLSLCLSLSASLSLSLSLTVAQDESASMCPCSSSLSGAPWWSSSSFSNWAPTAGWNYSSPPKLSPLFLNKCGCSNRGVLLIHLYRVECGVCSVY